MGPSTDRNSLMYTYGCFHKLGVLVVGVLMTRALPYYLGSVLGPLIFFKLPYVHRTLNMFMDTAAPTHNAASLLKSVHVGDIFA